MAQDKRSHKKLDATEAIREGRKDFAEQMRTTMSTGGGEPIPAGHKWTDEHRVKQPRDPKTGHFTYNADAQYGRKYKYHGKGDADPVSVRDMELGDVVEAGSVVNIGGKTWVVIETISKEKMVNYFKQFDEETGEYYDNGYDHKKSRKSGFQPESDDDEATKLTGILVKKRGRMTGQEREAVEAGKEGVVGKVDIESLGDSVRKEIADKLEAHLAGGDHLTPAGINSSAVTRLDPTSPKYQRNKKWNEMVASLRKLRKAKPAGVAPSEKPKSAPTPSTVGVPNTVGAPTSTASDGAGDKAKQMFGLAQDAKTDAGKYLSEHKEALTKVSEKLKEAEMDVSPEELVGYIADYGDDAIKELMDALGDE